MRVASRRCLLPGQGLFLLGGACSIFAAGLESQPEYLAARQALSEGLPAVAAVKAGRLLRSPESWNERERQALARLAVEGWVRARDGRSALEILKLADFPDRPFWEAQALMRMDDPEAAERLLLDRLRTGDASAEERLLLAQVSLAGANFSQAREILQGLREVPDAAVAGRARLMLDELEMSAGSYTPTLESLAALAESAEPTARFLHARGLVELGRQAEAQARLRAMLAGSPGGERIHHAAAILLADSLLRQENFTGAAEALVQFLDNTLESDQWSNAFDLLARALQSGDTELRLPDAALRWMMDGNVVQRQALRPLAATETFRGHAMLLLARWLMSQNRVMEALGMAEAMLQVHPGHPQASEAMRLALETYGTLKVDARVTALADQWRQRFGGSGSSLVDFVTAGTAFSRGEFKQSAQLFETAANVATSLAERRAALYNAGLAAIRAGETSLYLSLLGQLQVVSADAAVKSGDSSADLELDRALDIAARRLPDAQTELVTFAQRHTGHPRMVEALVALAETQLMQTPPEFGPADRTLKNALSRPGLTDGHRQRIALTRLWMLDLQKDLKGVTDTGSEFLKTWPNAAQAAQVRMKVAEAYFRQENFASARTEFELVARNHPESPFADTALYFAGMSAVSLIGDGNREAAISLWQVVAERGGPLSIPARQQQALAKRLLGKDDEALVLLDSLLQEKGLPEDTRRSLTCEKAELLMLQGETDAAKLTAAVAVLREMRREDDLSYFWRARAGYTLACALDAVGSTNEALEACYDVVQATGVAGPANPAEFRWYYRAGFFGIKLLENTKQWEAAARLAEKLAQSSGEGASEARERATNIRLDHFLWDGDAK